MARALERLEARVAVVLYEKQKWFKWVQQCQVDEETAQENEKKKIRIEAALFKKHTKDVQSRMGELRAKEDLKRQETYLDEVYNARLSEEEQEAHWDPIEDVIEDERGNYIDLIKHILLLSENVDDDQRATESEVYFEGMQEGEVKTLKPETKVSKNKKKKALTNGSSSAAGSSVQMLDKSAHDTKGQVRQRLKEGVKLKYGRGIHVVGTIDNPIETHEKTAPVPDDEIDRLLEDMGEIMNLLFCRILLSHATVLEVALQANSVDEFLNDKKVPDTELRDIALKLDNPGLQEIRDACADLHRGEEEADDKAVESDDEEEIEEDAERLKKLKISRKRYPGLERPPNTWAPEREKNVAKRKTERQSMLEDSPMFKMLGRTSEEKNKGQTMIDFGEIDDEGKFKSKKIRIKICGKYIYNYPSERAINWGGWLQFCLIAKNSDLHDAIKLCRHWDEFFELNILANYNYYPAANWLIWKGDRRWQQLLQLVTFSSIDGSELTFPKGLIPYMQFEHAEQLTERHQTGSRGQGRRAHNVIEVRNFMCA